MRCCRQTGWVICLSGMPVDAHKQVRALMQDPALLCCQGCGAVLCASGSVCARCEQQPTIMAGLHVCPRCEQRFDAPSMVLHPEQAPWYRLQTHRPKCPNCSSALRDRSRPELPSYGYPAVLLVCGVAQFLPWKRAAIGLLASALVVLIVLMLLRRERGVTEERRYATREP
jgi:hypothetical protein